MTIHPGHRTPKDDGSRTGIRAVSPKDPAGEEGNQTGDGPGYWSRNCWVTGPGNWHSFQKGDGSGNSNGKAARQQVGLHTYLNSMQDGHQQTFKIHMNLKASVGEKPH